METATTEVDGSLTAYRLGNAAWILLWTAAIAGMCYIVAAPDGPQPLRLLMLAIVSGIVLHNVGASMYYSFKRRANRSDAAIIADHVARADERQRHLHLKARSVTIVPLYGLAVLIVFLGIAAAAAGVHIDSVGRWMDLSIAFANAIMITEIVTMRVVARYLSRHG